MLQGAAPVDGPPYGWFDRRRRVVVGSGLLVLTLALGVALVASAAATFLFIRRRDQALRRMAEVVGRMTGGDFDVEVAPTGTGGAAALAGAVERMRRQVAERIGASSSSGRRTAQSSQGSTRASSCSRATARSCTRTTRPLAWWGR